MSGFCESGKLICENAHRCCILGDAERFRDIKRGGEADEQS